MKGLVIFTTQIITTNKYPINQGPLHQNKPSKIKEPEQPFASLIITPDWLKFY